MKNEEIINKYVGSFPDVDGSREWKTWGEIRESMNRDLNSARIDTIKQCAERAKTNYIERGKEIDLLKQETQRLELLRTEQYHEQEKLKQENEKLKEEVKKWEIANFLNKDIALKNFDDCVNEKHKNIALQAEIESLKGNIRQSGEIWSPVYDYIASHSEITVGDSIAGKTLQFIKERDELKGKLKEAETKISELINETLYGDFNL